MERSNADFLARIEERRSPRPRHWLAEVPEGERRRYYQASEADKKLMRATATSRTLDEFSR